MRVLVLGGAGMLGHKMVQVVSSTLPDTWCTVHGSRNEPRLAPIVLPEGERTVDHFDAAEPHDARHLLRRIQPDVVVNCIGVIKQRSEAKATIPSLAVNALLPHVVAETIEPWGGRLIHISTDCVFNGRRGNYTEADLTDAEDLYGRTKALGEVVAPNALVLRTSIIGRELAHHTSLLDWFLGQRGKTIRGFRQAWWSGVTTNHLADLVLDLVHTHPRLAGLYQVSSGRISKYELLHALRDVYSLDVTIDPDDDVRIDRSLSGAKLAAAIGYRCPPWATLLGQLVSDPTPYPRLTS